ncbi:4274_t:CDS:1, partial [Racocetra fulgida]
FANLFVENALIILEIHDSLSDNAAYTVSVNLPPINYSNEMMDNNNIPVNNIPVNNTFINNVPINNIPINTA